VRKLTISTPTLATVLRLGLLAQSGALLALGLLFGVLTASAASSAGTAQAVPPTPIPTPGSLPTPGPADQELTVDRVATDRYPRLTIRFTIEPFDGSPPQYLEPRDIGIVEAGIVDTPDEVYTVGRVPTHGFGTYEAVWPAHARVQPGDTVSGKLVFFRHNGTETSTDFRYIRPLPQTANAIAAPAAPTVLMAVPLPDPNAINVPLTSAIAACLMGTALLCAAAALAWREHVRRGQERLAIWVGRSAQERVRAASRAAAGRRTITISPFVQALGRIGARLVPSGQAEKIRRNLVLAGRPTNQHFTRFVAAKAGLSIGLFLFGFWLSVSLAPIITAVAIGLCLGTLGFVLPSTWLGRAIKKRQYDLRRALPDALDLMTIGVSAGLAFDGALAEIIEKWDNELSREFSVMLGELRIGVGRREALLNLADRTQVEEIQIMVSQLIQAEEMGMSLTDTLNKLADQMRLRRRQHAEELAAKAAIKMLIPLVFLIFPALFVVILGPAAQDLYTHFMSGNGP
jgi:tight adherence protein C